MPSSHLYLLQCSFARLENALVELSQLLNGQDKLVLMDDAVFALHSTQITQFESVYVLGNDDLLAPNNSSQAILHKCIDYDELTDLILEADKVFTWR